MVKFDDSIDEISKKAVEMVNNMYNYGYDCSELFGQYSPCYKFSNENISDYSKKLPMDRNSVLTVCGSGDQAITSIMMGTKNIDIFDSNLFTYFNMWLKIYAIKYLEYRDFNKLYDTKLNSKRIDLVEEILNNASNEMVKFWEPIFSSKNDMFRYIYRPFYDIDANPQIIPFLKPKSFNSLKEKFNNKLDYEHGIVGDSKIDFHCCDLLNILSFYGDKQYDFINLSNIFKYISDDVSKCKKFYQLCRQMITNNLNKGGSIILNYCWNRTGEQSLIDELRAYKIDLENYSFQNQEYHDSIMAYTKKK